MKRLISTVIFLALLILPLSVGAHGDGAHVMGTVTASEADHVVIETPKGKTLSLGFQPSTSFQHNGIDSKTARPQVGDRLVAEVTKKGLPDNRDWIATEIKFATPKKP